MICCPKIRFTLRTIAFLALGTISGAFIGLVLWANFGAYLIGIMHLAFDWHLLLYPLMALLGGAFGFGYTIIKLHRATVINSNATDKNA